MKEPLPEVLRVGALIRVAGRDAPSGTRAHALASMDLRFADGHVERWLGPGSLSESDVGADELVAWGTEVFDEQRESLVEELGMSFSNVTGKVFDGAPVEVVVEWNYDFRELDAELEAADKRAVALGPGWHHPIERK